MFKYARLFYPLLRMLPQSASQSFDNPIQVDRLPPHAAVEFDYPVFQDKPSVAARRTLLLLFVVALVAPLLRWTHSIYPITVIQGGLQTITLVIGGVCFVLGLAGTRWPFLAVGAAVLSVPILAELVVIVPYALAALFPAIIGSFIFADRLTTFYVHLKTAAPVPRARSLEARRLWSHHWWSLLHPLRGSELYVLNMLIFVLPIFLVVTHLARTEPGRPAPPLPSILQFMAATDPFVATTSIFAAIVLCALIWPFLLELMIAPWYGRKPAGPVRQIGAFWRALVEWTTYNRLRTLGVGVHVSPVGNCATRRRLLIGVLLLWACVWVGAQRPVNVAQSLPSQGPRSQRLPQDSKFIRDPRPGAPEIDDKPQFWPPPADLTSEIKPLTLPDGTTLSRPAGMDFELEPHELALLQRLSAERRDKYLADRVGKARAEKETLSQQSEQQQINQTSANLVLLLFFRLVGVAVQVLVPTLGVLITAIAVVFGAAARPLTGAEALFGNEPRQRILSSENWESLVERLQSSNDTIEKNSLFLGTNSRDDTPVLIPRDVFGEHAHILGDSGSGKTSLGLMPLIAQLMRSQDCSVVVIDLKADDQALFETLQFEADRNARVAKRKYPLRWFTTELDRSSYIFNPLTQRVMSRLPAYQRTDIISAALGLQYGTDYGRKYFGDANYDLLNYALQHFSEVDSFTELAEVLHGAKHFPIDTDNKKAASNVQSAVRRLARCEPLCSSPRQKSDPAALAQAIDFADLFAQPQAVYFALPPSSGIAMTAEIARIAVYSMLAAAQLHEGKRKPVYLVIDEFQRIVSNNLALLLQTARSMDIGVILANQSLADLETPDTDLIASVKTNTRFRQVFAAGSLDDIRELRDTSGETMATYRAWGDLLPNLLFDGWTARVSLREGATPRLMLNDILLATDAFGRNIACLRRGAGYAQYGGMPFTMDSVHHISPEIYKARKDAKWPQQRDGTIVSRLPLPPTAPDLGDRILKAPEDDEEIDPGTGSGILTDLDVMHEEYLAKLAKQRARRKKVKERSFRRSPSLPLIRDHAMSQQPAPAAPDPVPPPQPTPLEPLSSQLRIRPDWRTPWLVISVVIIVGIILVITGNLRFGSGDSTGIGGAEGAKRAAEKSVEFGSDADREAVQVSWRRLHGQLQTVQTDQAALAKDLESLVRQLSELRQSDAGRRLAADGDLIEQFLTIEQHSRPSLDSLAGSRADVEKLIQVCERGAQDANLLVEPGTPLKQQADTISTEAKESLSQVKSDLAGLAALLRRAAKNSPAAGSLAETIVQREQDRDDLRLAELTKKRQELRDAAEEKQKQMELEAARRLEEQKQEEARLEKEREIAEAKAEAERKQAALDEEKERQAAEKAHREKLKKFEKALPEIRSLLSPMITKGRMQIGPLGWTAGEEGPLSLNALKRNKVLELNDTGLYAINGLFCGPACPNDRSRGGFPESFPSNQPKLRRAQELLVEFGDILVEKKMLRP